MVEKICRACGKTKTLDQFYAKPTQPCRTCWAETVRTRYASNPGVRAKAKEASRRWRTANLEKAHSNEKKSKQKRKRTIQEQVRVYKSIHPCADCGRTLPHWVMQFDHRSEEAKHMAVALLVKNNTTFAQVKREIAKCDLVCAVCHAHRTYCRAQGTLCFVLQPSGAPKQWTKS